MILKYWGAIEIFFYAKPSSSLIFLVQTTKLKDTLRWVKNPFEPLINFFVRPLMREAVRTSLARLMWALLVPAGFAVDRTAIEAERLQY